MTTSPRNTTLTSTTPVGAPRLPGAPAPRVLPARPEPLALHATDSALIVVDMQNAYASLGGYVDSAGFDISGAQGTIANIARTIAAARAAGMLVVFLQNGWDAAYVDEIKSAFETNLEPGMRRIARTMEQRYRETILGRSGNVAIASQLLDGNHVP